MFSSWSGNSLVHRAACGCAAVVFGAAILSSGVRADASSADSDYLPSPDALSLKPSVDHAAGEAGEQATEEKPFFLDAAGGEQPNIHGFFNSPFKTAYVTPRGLVVQNKGLVWQPITGTVIPIGDLGPITNVAFVGGIWNSVDTYESKFNATTGAWDEMDVFAALGGTIFPDTTANLTFGVWNSPEHAFKTEYNLDLKIAYDDSKFWGNSGISLNPYVDLWWAIAGSSTVILGRQGGTGYVEPGIVPTYTLKMMTDYPLTITMPTYISLGPSSYWDAHSTFGHKDVGVASVSLNLSVPLAFIPARYGHWHADAGVTYDYLINNALLHAGTLASGNTERNVVFGSAGFGFNF